MVKKFLTEHGIIFNERKREVYPEDIEFLKEQGFKTYPVTIIDEMDLVIKGFDIKKLKEIEGDLKNA